MTDGFKIIGISIRTTNRNMQSTEDMGKLWARFFDDKIIEKVVHKASMEIIAIYTDYESDYTGEYTTIIGFPVLTLEVVPQGLVGREFKSANFQKFVAKGAIPKAVVDTWTDIWNRDHELDRAYTYDFEIYGEKSQNGEDSEVEIYLAKK